MDHKDLEVWKNAIDFVVEIYKIVDKFPKNEEFGLKSQMKRASVSVSSNIAEGAARKSDKEFVQFLYISLGSLAELETQLIISEKLGFISQIEMEKLIAKIAFIRKPAFFLLKYLKQK
jgi:four helix bundle protein